jgi:hypothetical protein
VLTAYLLVGRERNIVVTLLFLQAKPNRYAPQPTKVTVFDEKRLVRSSFIETNLMIQPGMKGKERGYKSFAATVG